MAVILVGVFKESCFWFLNHSVAVNREVKHDVYGKRQTAKMKLLPSLFSCVYTRVKLFVFTMNSRRRYSISVCFIYGLEENNSKSVVIFAVCRLPLTSCLTSLLAFFLSFNTSTHRKGERCFSSWQHCPFDTKTEFSCLSLSIHYSCPVKGRQVWIQAAKRDLVGCLRAVPTKYKGFLRQVRTTWKIRSLRGLLESTKKNWGSHGFLSYFCAVLRFSDPPYAPLIKILKLLVNDSIKTILGMVLERKLLQRRF